jgi:hypothetical protein
MYNKFALLPSNANNEKLAHSFVHGSLADDQEAAIVEGPPCPASEGTFTKKGELLNQIEEISGNK